MHLALALHYRMLSPMLYAAINLESTEKLMAVTTRTGGRLLVDCLQSLGAHTCFGVPGESYLAVLDALHDTRGTLDFILCRHEGGAAFMAEAYGKLTGSPGICMVTRGPGATNASIGVHTAMQNSSPMLLFIGQVETSQRNREAFQEIDYRAFFGSIAKWAVEIDDADRIPELVARAWSIALSGRPGPVVVALPENMLSSLSDANPCRAVHVAEPAPPARVMQHVEHMLNTAKQPLMLVGGGGWNPSGRDALQRFSEANDIPVVAAFRFQDVMDNHSPNYVGEAGVGMWPSIKALISQADVILAVNVRFGEMTTDGWSLLDIPHPKVSLIHVHTADSEIGKIYVPDIPIHSGPNNFFESAINMTMKNQWQSWSARARQRYLDGMDIPEQTAKVDMVTISRWLRTHLPEDVVLTNGAGNFTVWPNKFFCFGKHQRLLAPQSGAMGYGLPAAIAAKVADPKRTVVCFAGDGDFQMNCNELGTAMQASAQPIILILNNGSYGTIRMHQEKHYPARVSGTDLENPDFVALARAYGFHAESVHSTDEFADAFERALQSLTGAVIDIRVSVETITAMQSLRDIRNAALAAKQ